MGFSLVMSAQLSRTFRASGLTKHQAREKAESTRDLSVQNVYYRLTGAPVSSPYPHSPKYYLTTDIFEKMSV